MICNYWLLAFLPLAACSREGSSAPATREEPAMSSGRQPALRPDAAPVPPAPRPGAGPTPPARPRIPREDAQDFGVHLPAFSFRTMDDNPAQVQLNGEDLSTTPCLWSIPQHLKVTDAAVPRGWPPEGGRLVGKTRHPEDPSSEAEPCVVHRPELLAKIPGLQKDECVLAFRGVVGGCHVQGSLLLYARDCRFVDDVPLLHPEGDEASRFLRTLWFERMPDE